MSCCSWIVLGWSGSQCSVIRFSCRPASRIWLTNQAPPSSASLPPSSATPTVMSPNAEGAAVSVASRQTSSANGLIEIPVILGEAPSVLHVLQDIVQQPVRSEPDRIGCGQARLRRDRVDLGAGLLLCKCARVERDRDDLRPP